MSRENLAAIVDGLEDMLALIDHTRDCSVNLPFGNPYSDYCDCDLRNRRIKLARHIDTLKRERDSEELKTNVQP